MQQILNLDGSLVPFLPATLTNDASRGWHVYYHIFNPMTGELERRATKLNRVRRQFRTQMEFRAYASKFVMEINAKLASGWSPYSQENNARSYHTIKEIGVKYLNEKQKELSSETLRILNASASNSRNLTLWNFLITSTMSTRLIPLRRMIAGS